ncbi:hypothetical protein H696_00095 [Fonticula alba]|uniref:Uncharacterized protein n=1 Tax=Fonticula alba TaxID=691883 RepID=A0A058ZDN0_FONAL|nr:hypothetical protein H696_00095 [Fonticula alba]KCV72500.1 hypothetical protein H696_00095 [Fonticula alba]|eukprot:XP_009492201.1 hypothetical protein H696_00095 [Fonticula alba]
MTPSARLRASILESPNAMESIAFGAVSTRAIPDLVPTASKIPCSAEADADAEAATSPPVTPGAALSALSMLNSAAAGEAPPDAGTGGMRRFAVLRRVSAPRVAAAAAARAAIATSSVAAGGSGHSRQPSRAHNSLIAAPESLSTDEECERPPAGARPSSVPSSDESDLSASGGHGSGADHSTRPGGSAPGSSSDSDSSSGSCDSDSDDSLNSDSGSIVEFSDGSDTESGAGRGRMPWERHSDTLERMPSLSVLPTMLPHPGRGDIDPAVLAHYMQLAIGSGGEEDGDGSESDFDGSIAIGGADGDAPGSDRASGTAGPPNDAAILRRLEAARQGDLPEGEHLFFTLDQYLRLTTHHNVPWDHFVWDYERLTTTLPLRPGDGGEARACTVSGPSDLPPPAPMPSPRVDASDCSAPASPTTETSCSTSSLIVEPALSPRSVSPVPSAGPCGGGMSADSEAPPAGLADTHDDSELSVIAYTNVAACSTVTATTGAACDAATATTDEEVEEGDDTDTEESDDDDSSSDSGDSVVDLGEERDAVISPSEEARSRVNTPGSPFEPLVVDLHRPVGKSILRRRGDSGTSTPTPVSPDSVASPVSRVHWSQTVDVGHTYSTFEYDRLSVRENPFDDDSDYDDDDDEDEDDDSSDMDDNDLFSRGVSETPDNPDLLFVDEDGFASYVSPTEV